MAKKNKTNKERLICIENMVESVLTWQNNHMEHHKRIYDKLFKVFLVALSPIVVSIIGLITWIIVSIIKLS